MAVLLAQGGGVKLLGEKWISDMGGLIAVDELWRNISELFVKNECLEKLVKLNEGFELAVAMPQKKVVLSFKSGNLPKWPHFGLAEYNQFLQKLEFEGIFHEDSLPMWTVLHLFFPSVSMTTFAKHQPDVFFSWTFLKRFLCWKTSRKLQLHGGRHGFEYHLFFHGIVIPLRFGGHHPWCILPGTEGGFSKRIRICNVPRPKNSLDTANNRINNVMSCHTSGLQVLKRQIPVKCRKWATLQDFFRQRTWRAFTVFKMSLVGSVGCCFLQVWLGTSDDWIGSSDRPTKEQGGNQCIRAFDDRN